MHVRMHTRTWIAVYGLLQHHNSGGIPRHAEESLRVQPLLPDVLHHAQYDGGKRLAGILYVHHQWYTEHTSVWKYVHKREQVSSDGAVQCRALRMMSFRDDLHTFP